MLHPTMLGDVGPTCWLRLNRPLRLLNMLTPKHIKLQQIFCLQVICLRNHSADANTICNVLNQQLENNKLEKSKLSSFASDEASVMTGVNNGVAPKLRSRNNKKLIHQLALACGDANNSVSYILTVEKILIQLCLFSKIQQRKLLNIPRR